ncbi:MAG: TonB family protein [Methylovulum sp.]|uniref:energy transducer TonB n=1 Tax=Methylovulum sp. TaxID=1916980 RepID=UPI002621E24C|nr:TonB family protein [Methylovulum sp.]MDD2723636.1 TonB family protein [Methylovulum sp.]MDD5123871.1 TonB family protein [Methylovulum sp.]
MTKKAAFRSSPVISNNDAIIIALFIAAIIHVIVVLGVNFTSPKPEKFNRSIDITLVNTPAKKAPKAARFLAPEHQVGAGDAVKQTVLPKQQLPSLGNSERKIIKKPAEIQNKPKSVEKILTQKAAPQKVDTDINPEEGDNTERPHLTEETLLNQLAQLGTEIRLSQQSSDDSKIKSVSQVSAHQFIAAQYQKDWEAKVERVGNMNYPEVAAQKNFSGRLTMEVGIRSDGGIDHIYISRSSGNPALDEAAKNIVKMSAPFAPFSSELLKEVNVLIITRVWKFSDESGMSTH